MCYLLYAIRIDLFRKFFFFYFSGMEKRYCCQQKKHKRTKCGNHAVEAYCFYYEKLEGDEPKGCQKTES